MSGRIEDAIVDFAAFRLNSIAFVALWLGRFWCETGAATPRSRRGARIGIRRSLADFSLVKQLTLNHRVPGSSPGAPTTQPLQTALFGDDAK